MSATNHLLAAAHAEVKAEIVRTDTKTGLLLAFVGAVLAGAWTVAKGTPLPLSSYWWAGRLGPADRGGWTAAPVGAAKPGRQARFPAVGDSHRRRDRGQPVGDLSADIAGLSRLAVAKFTGLRRAVDLTCAGGALLILAALIAAGVRCEHRDPFRRAAGGSAADEAGAGACRSRRARRGRGRRAGAGLLVRRGVGCRARWGFGEPWMLPVGIDVAIPVFTVANLLLIRMDMALAWVRFVPWVLTLITCGLNVAAGHDAVGEGGARHDAAAVGGVLRDRRAHLRRTDRRGHRPADGEDRGSRGGCWRSAVDVRPLAAHDAVGGHLLLRGVWRGSGSGSWPARSCASGTAGGGGRRRRGRSACC